jgi:hypothetical protein
VTTIHFAPVACAAIRSANFGWVISAIAPHWSA